MDIRTAIENTKSIYMSNSSLNVLLDFERVLDELDLYSFKNWIKGELVEGPVIEKYWVSCTFMWPKKMMPDPSGAERLLPYGCHISYRLTEIHIPMTIKKPQDMRPDGSRHGKLVPVKVWLVKIEMPQELIADVEQGSVELAGDDVDIEDINDAYQQGLDQKALQDNEDGSQTDQGQDFGQGNGMDDMNGGMNNVPTI